jgi:hypothetical protein
MSVEMLDRVYGHHHPEHLRGAAHALGYRRPQSLAITLAPARRPRPSEQTTCWKYWWRTQSKSNPSPLPNSLLTGKLTGNYVEFARLMRFRSPTGEQIQRLATKFPTQQNREFLRRNREFARENREFERAIEQSDFLMIFSEGTATR